MCEPRNRDNGASDLWTLTAYYGVYADVKESMLRILEGCHLHPVTAAYIQQVARRPRNIPR